MGVRGKLFPPGTLLIENDPAPEPRVREPTIERATWIAKLCRSRHVLLVPRRKAHESQHVLCEPHTDETLSVVILDRRLDLIMVSESSRKKLRRVEPKTYIFDEEIIRVIIGFCREVRFCPVLCVPGADHILLTSERVLRAKRCTPDHRGHPQRHTGANRIRDVDIPRHCYRPGRYIE